jgi:hypothetical protein
MTLTSRCEHCPYSTTANNKLYCTHTRLTYRYQLYVPIRRGGMWPEPVPVELVAEDCRRTYGDRYPTGRDMYGG